MSHGRHGNKLTKGRLEFEMDNVYVLILKALNHRYFRDYEVTETTLQSKYDQWAQTPYMDIFDVIGFINKYGKITKLDFYYTYQVDYPNIHLISLDEEGTPKTDTFLNGSPKPAIICEESIIFDLLKSKKYTTFNQTGFASGTFINFMFGMAVDLFINRSLRRIENKKQKLWDFRVISLAIKTGFYFEIFTPTHHIYVSDNGTQYKSQERPLQEMVWGRDNDFGPLTQASLDLEDPRKIIVTIGDDEVALPLFEPLMLLEKYGPRRGYSVKTSSDHLELVCDHCVFRVARLLGKSKCDSYCEVQKTDRKGL
jgi:hypothetical protein